MYYDLELDWRGAEVLNMTKIPPTARPAFVIISEGANKQRSMQEWERINLIPRPFLYI